MKNWAKWDKRDKSSGVVKSLLATSNTTLVCSIAEVRIHEWLIIKGGLIMRGAYYSECKILANVKFM